MISPQDLAQILSYVQERLPAVSIGQGFPDVVATVFQAADFIVNGNGAFFYSGIPATGNLLATVAPAAGTDLFGNAYLSGVTAYVPPGAQALAVQLSQGRMVFWSAPTQAGPYVSYQVFDGTTFLSAINAPLVHANQLELPNLAVPAGVGGAIEAFASSGQLKYVSGATGDTNAYNTGRATFLTTARQTINSTSDIPVTGITGIPVAAGRYEVHGAIFASQGGAAFANNIGFTGPAVSDCGIGFRVLEGTTIFATGFLTSLTTFSTGVIPTLTTFETYFDGIVTFSAAGLFGMRANEGMATHIWNIEIDSYLRLEPVT